LGLWAQSCHFPHRRELSAGFRPYLQPTPINVILKFTGVGRIIGIVQSKYLNNIVLAGIEAAHTIRKGQLDQAGTSAFKQFAALAG